MINTKSKDGTSIAFEKVGKGPSLIIVGGSLANHQMYIPLAQELSNKFTVYNYDRRNRGQSGHTRVHTVDSELEDLEAIASLTQGPVILYGHSAGAALAIRAVANGLNTSKLILADPPFSPSGHNSDHESKRHASEAQKIKELIDSGNKKGAVKFFLKDFGMTEQELESFVQSQEAQPLIECANTLPIDYEILGNGMTPIELVRHIRIPTLILTAEYGLTSAKDIARNIPNCSIQILANPAHNLSPQDIAKLISNFIK